MIRFGICGTGAFVAAAVLPSMSRLEGVEVSAVCDPDPEARKRASELFGVELLYTDIDAMLAGVDIDAVYVGSPNACHLDHVSKAAQAGKHVLCQKPLGLTAAECRRMIDICEANKVNLGVGFCNRFSNAQKRAKKLIVDGVLGKINYIDMSMSAYFPPNARSSWRFDRALSGGGPLMDLAPHIIDLAHFLLDDEVESVQAYVTPDVTEHRVEDGAVATMLFKNGIQGTLETSFSRIRPYSYTICGDKGTLRAVGTMAWLTGGEKIGSIELRTLDGIVDVGYEGNEHIEEEISAFCLAIENTRRAPVSGEDGLRAQAVIDAIYESSRTGRRCRVEL